MACKVIILMSALVAVAKSGLAPVAAPVVAAAKVVDTEFDPNPQYTYAYDVQDSLTGDSKNQFETRDGDIVRGRYSLIEADGTRRIVDYTADPVNGFNAVVQREPAVVKAAVVAPAPVAKFIAPAPIVAAPVPVAKYVAPAPVVAAPVPVAKFVAAPAPIAKFVAAPAPVAKFVAAPAPLVAKYAAAPYAQFVSAAPVAPLPAIAKVAAPLLAAPFARYASPVAYPYAKVVAPAPVAKFAAPLSYPAPVAYTAPVAAPLAKFVSPFGAYNVL